MPNRKAKRRKDERREKDDYLSKNGRTPAQISCNCRVCRVFRRDYLRQFKNVLKVEIKVIHRI